MSRIMKVMSLLVALVAFAGTPSTAGAQQAGAQPAQPKPPAGPKIKPVPVKDVVVTPGGTGGAGAVRDTGANGPAATGPDSSSLSKVEPYVKLHRERASLLEDYATKLRAVCSDKTGFGDYEAIKRAARSENNLAPGAPSEADFEPFKDDVCARLCAPAKGADGLDFCALRDRSVASSAVIADWDSAVLVIVYINEQLEKLRQKRADLFQLARNGELQAAVPLFGLQKERERFVEELEAADSIASVATLSADALRVGLSALARVIVDRAKRESIGFFLDRMGRALCQGEIDESDSAAEKATKKKAAHELRTYWFPATCALAADKGSYMLQYGGGARLLGALRAAVESDLSGWPGAAASLVLGQAFLGSPGKSCAADSATDECVAYRELRTETQRLISDLLSGKNYAAALDEFGSSFDALNHRASGARFNTSLQFAACAASMPLYLQQYGGALSTELGSAEGARSILIAGFAAAPACWSLFGEGIDRHTCDLFGGSAKACKARLPRPAAGPLERLSTVVRLHRVVGRAAHSVGQRLSLLQGALKQYEAALEAPATATPASQVTLPKLELTSVESAGAALSAMEGFARSMDRLGELRAYQRRIAAAAAVASASFALAESALVVVGEAPPELLPALPAAQSPHLRTFVGRARTYLDSMQRAVDSVAAIARQDFGVAATRALALLRAEATKQCTLESCARLRELWSRFAPVLVAVVTETDPDAVAEAIEQAASPPGGWKRKGVKDTFMFSLASHAGIMGGVELRHGQYGVVRENFRKGYGVAPALMLPVGFDFTWGNDGGVNPVGLFVSLIDPLAFLQYDTSEDGRLPGPSLTTVLAPGLSLRLGINETPFSVLLPHVVYRPGLRAWDPEIAGPAASVLQVGAGLSVDVTLLDIVVKP